VKRVFKERQVSVVRLVSRARPASKESKGLLASKEFRVFKDHKVIKVRQVFRESKEIRVIRVSVE
jgi:hypothetical protein